MRRRVLFILATIVLALILGIAGLLATSEVQQIGAAGGVRYRLALSGFEGYTFAPLKTGFRFQKRSWFGLGGPSLEVAVENGRLIVDQADHGPIQPGEQVTVTRDSRVLINDRQLDR
jgi:hypothetical protein